jgi:hypothetical protein
MTPKAIAGFAARRLRASRRADVVTGDVPGAELAKLWNTSADWLSPPFTSA